MANFCRGVTMTDSGIEIPLSQISANYYDEQNTALNLKNIEKQCYVY